jgi:hypothetical protein
MAINQLPIHTFQINYQSELDGKDYKGLFSVRKKVISDAAKISVKRLQLNGGYHFDSDNPGVGMDQTTDSMNYVLANLDVLLTQAPPWFDLDSITDFGLVLAVWEEVKKFQNSFRKQPEPNRVSETRSNPVEAKSDDTGSTPDMVFQQVQASLEPR